MGLDFERLRAELSDYYGTAAFAGNPAAFIDLETVQTATDEGLISLAREAGIPVEQYML